MWVVYWYITKDYFPEGTGLSNLSRSTIKEQKTHDSQLFLGDTHYNREGCHKNHSARTQRSRDVP